jgi:hypothetical protein
LKVTTSTEPERTRCDMDSEMSAITTSATAATTIRINHRKVFRSIEGVSYFTTANSGHWFADFVCKVL